LTKDPIRFAGGDPNLYAYCNNDPVNHVDPGGLIFTDTCRANPPVCAAAMSGGPTTYALTPQGRQTLQGIGAVGARVGQGLGNAVQAVRNFFSCPRTLPGVGPDTARNSVNAFANTPAVPRGVQTVPSIVQSGQQGIARSQQAIENARAILEYESHPARQWVYRTLEATAPWRTNLPFEEQRAALNSIFESARIIFGVPFWSL
jgi:hypothetical protein